MRSQRSGSFLTHAVALLLACLRTWGTHGHARLSLALLAFACLPSIASALGEVRLGDAPYVHIYNFHILPRDIVAPWTFLRHDFV